MRVSERIEAREKRAIESAEQQGHPSENRLDTALVAKAAHDAGRVYLDSTSKSKSTPYGELDADAYAAFVDGFVSCPDREVNGSLSKREQLYEAIVLSVLKNFL